MPDVVHYDIRDTVAVITIDNPPVNALAPGVLEGIEDAVRRACADASVTALVLVGARDTFVAGADINQFRTIATRDEAAARSAGFHRSLRQIERAAKPVVAAIHGHALGGGLELAMACHYRVAVATAKLGQPEVQLGLIPGAGGTQRLPRLVTVPAALDMCIAGTPITAADALAAGLVDEVVEPSSAMPARDALVARAVGFARERAAGGEIRRTSDLAIKGSQEAAKAACAERRAQLAAAADKTPAPLAVVDAIEAACTLDFEQGSLVEQQRFADCLVSIASRALVHLFFAEREAAKVPGVPKGTPARNVQRAAVVGAGTMGVGIAMTYANAGIPVLLKDVDEAALDRALGAMRGLYESAVAKRRTTAAAAERAMALVTPTTTYDQFDQVDVVVEAVFEEMALKRATFAELGQVTRPGCVLASNTSTLDVDALADASGRPHEVIGHHFFSPAHVMKLVEVVRGRATAPETIATSQSLVKRLGKIGVVVGNCFGFVANRMLMPYLREAYLMLEEGAPVSQIDRTMVEFGMPVGPFAMEDIAGLDVGARIRRELRASPGAASWPHSEVADRLVAMGRFGQKTGAGWYRYEPGSRQPLADPIVEALAEETAVSHGVTRRAVPDEEILERLTTALANEGARVLGEGFASRAGDIDVIYCYGFGFPRYRGGPMFYASTIGLPAVLAAVEKYRERVGPHWEPAPLLEQLVRDRQTFAGNRGSVTATLQ